jgi:hypothetical protein
MSLEKGFCGVEHALEKNLVAHFNASTSNGVTSAGTPGISGKSGWFGGRYRGLCVLPLDPEGALLLRLPLPLLMVDNQKNEKCAVYVRSSMKRGSRTHTRTHSVG